MKTNETQLIEQRSEFLGAVRGMLDAAQWQLLIHDRDLSDWDLDSAAAAQDMQRVLRATQGSIRIVVHDAHWIETRAPRIAQLRRLHDARLLCRLAPPHLPARDGVLVADGIHLLHRAQPGQWRGRFGRHVPQEAEPWSSRFDELWHESVPLSPVTALGL